MPVPIPGKPDVLATLISLEIKRETMEAPLLFTAKVHLLNQTKEGAGQSAVVTFSDPEEGTVGVIRTLLATLEAHAGERFFRGL